MGSSFEASLDYLENLYHLPFVPSTQAGLERARFLLSMLGDPHLTFRSVHVTGSCGKGSVTTMIGSILQASGRTTGFFRSPHLESYTERISIGGTDITPLDWVHQFDQVHPIAENMRLGLYPDYGLGRPTLFEILFAMACLHFVSHDVKWAAVEVGLGGRLDATNLLQSDVSAITNVSLEHTHILGNTIAAIALEKAAIIKPGSYALTAADHPDAVSIIERQARKVGAPLLRVGHDISATEISHDGTNQTVALRGRDVEVVAPLRAQGRYQQVNAAVAFGAALALRERGVPISDDAVRQGLVRAWIPGRFEVLPGAPTIVFDGAHNRAGMAALASSLEARGTPADVMLFGAMDDKDIEGMALAMKNTVRSVIVTRVPGSTRTGDLACFIAAFEAANVPVSGIEDTKSALHRAVRETGRDGLLLVSGSLYLVGFARHVVAGAEVL